MQKSNVAKLRTIHGFVEEIRALDPDTCITENFVRQKCKSKEIPCLIYGNRTLIEVESGIEAISEIVNKAS